jgi:peptide/nickel transport system substrate-binding protein
MSKGRKYARALVLAASIGVGICAGWVVGAHAADLRIATRTDISSMDPHFHNVAQNVAVSGQIFETLVDKDSKLKLRPGLAVSWTLISDTEWEFKLRPGVKFHDGTPFTAEDVAWSLRRIPGVPNSPMLFTMYSKLVKDVRVVDPQTVRLITDGPAPTLLNDLSKLFMVSRRATEGKASSDFSSPAVAVGTGPYRLVSWVPGDRVTLAANPDYWGGKEPWDNVALRPIGNDTARAAALISGDVDMIEGVPVSDRQRLAADPKISVFETDSIRVLYIHLDTNRDKSPTIADANGQPMDRNPLKDWRVRQAMNIAINRQGLTDRLLNGQAKPVGQLTPTFLFGASQNLPPPQYDPAKAEALLKEAGWGQGFSLRLASTNDRYPLDAQVAQAIAQMLTRVGIKTQVDAMPASMLFSRGSKLEFSALMAGWFSDSGEASSSLVSMLATYDPAKGMGPANRGRYSNPKLDEALALSLRTMDDNRRAALIAEAVEIGMRDVGMIPLYAMVNTWATRKGLTYDARTDELTLAQGVRGK